MKISTKHRIEKSSSEVLTGGPAVINESVVQKWQQKLLCGLLFTHVSLCQRFLSLTGYDDTCISLSSPWHGNHLKGVMCHFNQKQHISFVSMAICAFCPCCSDVNLVFICGCPSVNASEQKTGIQVFQCIRLCVYVVILEMATCHSQIHMDSFKQWHDPRWTIETTCQER